MNPHTVSGLTSQPVLDIQQPANPHQAGTILPIKGYRIMLPEEVALINEIKTHAEQIGGLLEKVRRFGDDNCRVQPTDMRWHAIAKTDLQKGFMSLVRSVAQPEGF